MCICVLHACIVPLEVRRVSSPGSVVTGCWEPPCGCCEQTCFPMQEHQALSTAEPSLASSSIPLPFFSFLSPLPFETAYPRAPWNTGIFLPKSVPLSQHSGGRSLSVPGRSGTHSETVSKTNKEQTKHFPTWRREIFVCQIIHVCKY